MIYGVTELRRLYTIFPSKEFLAAGFSGSTKHLFSIRGYNVGYLSLKSIDQFFDLKCFESLISIGELR